ncbi:MAG: tRNA pseudouridine(55) synthase TruB [Nakamurella sp.]
MTAMEDVAAPTGLLLVDKPQGVTSHDVVARVRAILHTRRVGHAGTLDPMATGLLVIAVGRATKLLGHLALAEKTYTATIRLGEGTDTDDAEGEITSRCDASAVSDDRISAGMTLFTGDIDQVPSSYSAIKVDGRRAYDRARSGEEVTLAARKVTVSRFERVAELRHVGQCIDIDVVVDCTTGTYVRALARDVGGHLGVGGHLTALRRHSIGPFSIDEAVNVFPDGVTPRGEPRPPIDDALRTVTQESVISAALAARRAFPTHTVDDAAAADLRFGRRIPSAGIDGVYAVFDSAGELLALVEDRTDEAKPVFVWQAAN